MFISSLKSILKSSSSSIATVQRSENRSRFSLDSIPPVHGCPRRHRPPPLFRCTSSGLPFGGQFCVVLVSLIILGCNSFYQDSPTVASSSVQKTGHSLTLRGPCRPLAVFPTSVSGAAATFLFTCSFLLLLDYFCWINSQKSHEWVRSLNILVTPETYSNCYFRKSRLCLSAEETQGPPTPQHRAPGGPSPRSFASPVGPTSLLPPPRTWMRCWGLSPGHREWLSGTLDVRLSTSLGEL